MSYFKYMLKRVKVYQNKWKIHACQVLSIALKLLSSHHYNHNSTEVENVI
jgi:hypothetical protein